MNPNFGNDPGASNWLYLSEGSRRRRKKSFRKGYLVYSIDDKNRVKVHQGYDTPAEAFRHVTKLKSLFRGSKAKFGVRYSDGQNVYHSSVQKCLSMLKQR